MTAAANYISLNQAKQAFAEGKSVRALKKAVKQRWKQQEAMEAALEASLLNDEPDAEEENAVPVREPTFA